MTLRGVKYKVHAVMAQLKNGDHINLLLPKSLDEGLLVKKVLSKVRQT